MKVRLSVMLVVGFMRQDAPIEFDFQRPVKTGVSLAANVRRPSIRSALSRSSPNACCSISNPAASGTRLPSTASFLIAAAASGALEAMRLAMAIVDAVPRPNQLLVIEHIEHGAGRDVEQKRTVYIGLQFDEGGARRAPLPCRNRT